MLLFVLSFRESTYNVMVRRTIFLVFVLFGHIGIANWLHQCSQCVDQSYYSDMSLKTDIRSANTSQLYSQMKGMTLREFEHIEKEFFNRFFSRSQLGLIAQELQPVCPSAVSMIPERRYTSVNGTQVSTKNLLMIRESHILFVLLGALQEAAKRLDMVDKDYWNRVDEWDRSLSHVTRELVTVSDKHVEVEQAISQTTTKLQFIGEQSETIYRAVKIAEDRVSEVRGSISVANDRISEFMKRYQIDSLSMATAVSGIRNDVSSLTTIVEVLRNRLDIMQRRLSVVESEMLRSLNERTSMGRVDRDRVRWIKMLLSLEQKKKVSENVLTQLAQRREEFDRTLVSLKEEADLRVLREKSAIESVAAERQVKFEREKMNVEMAIRIEEARIESEMKLRDKRENEDINLRELAERNSADQNKVMAIVNETAKILSTWIRDLYASPETLLLAIGSIVGLVAGVYLAKEGAQLVREELSRRLGKPDLVRVTSRKSLWRDVFDSILIGLGVKSSLSFKSAFSDVVLPPDLQAQISRLASSTRSASSSRSPLMNMMFYGEPGTGKTMVAKRFAEFSDLDYAIMSGGDIAPLGADAVTEIHKLFKWVTGSRRGLVLFIDEAESFLAQRSGGMSENLRNAITALLFHTGTASNRFMLILATNRPGDLDSAIIDRIDERIEFPLPNLSERTRLVEMYLQRYAFGNEFQGETLEKVAGMTRGFSGREISKLMMAVTLHGKTSQEVILSVTKAKVLEHEKIRNIVSNGYSFDRSKLDSCNNEHLAAR